MQITEIVATFIPLGSRLKENIWMHNFLDVSNDTDDDGLVQARRGIDCKAPRWTSPRSLTRHISRCWSQSMRSEFPTNSHAWPWACARSWNLQEMVKEKKTIVVLFASTIPFEWSSVDLRLPNSTSSLEVHSRVHIFPPLPYFRVSCRSIWSWHMILVQDNWLLWLIGICGMFKNIECRI